MSQVEEKKEEVKETTKKAGNETAQKLPVVRWDDSKMTSHYANVCNVASTREEVTLLFGTNQSWHTGQKELTVELTNRVILNPFAAKRLLLLLGNTVREYEARFGELRIDIANKG